MRLILVDGNAILHRAYHALPPLTNREGKLINAVYGFWGMLLRVTEDLKPTHLIVAFDTEKPTFRHAAFVGYQAHRPRVESDLTDQFAIVQETLEAAGVPVYAVPGYEADDVIGTLARQIVGLQSTVDSEVIIVTGDRDLLQLVNENVKVYMPVKGLTEARLLDHQGVIDYLGITPEEVVDYKALVGDPSDNYPGVPGIGPKTAIDLIKRYKTVDGIYQSMKHKTESIKKDVSERTINKLIEGYDSAMLSRKLAQIETDVPITLNLDEAELVPFVGNQSLVEKFRELGFRSLTARVEGREVKRKGSEEKKKGKDQLELI